MKKFIFYNAIWSKKVKIFDQPFFFMKTEFFYRNKLYPFNYELFHSQSAFFQRQKRGNYCKKIFNLVNEYDNIPYLQNETVESFINYCQDKNCQITDSNAVGLYCLSKKYEISTLITKTMKYIQKRYDGIIEEFFSDIENCVKFNTYKYEEIISEHFSFFVHDDRLLLLSLPTICRILTQYYVNNKNEEQEEKEEIMKSFIIKCIENFGNQSSILFINQNFGIKKNEFLDEILSKYVKISDFRIIKMMYEIQNEKIYIL